MKKIDVAKEWGMEVFYYYLWEGKNSAEQFCVDVLVPALNDSDEKIEIDFSNTLSGLTVQQVWIIGYYLVRNANFDAATLKERVLFKEEAFSDIQEEFLLSINEASLPYLKLITSNYSKLIEFNRLASHTSFAMEMGKDILEVQADSRTVAFYKALDVGPKAVVEDTILEIDGSEVVDIRYKLDEINSLKDSVPAKWITTLAHNNGESISLYVGVVNGTLKSIEKTPEDAFGFDANFFPDGSTLSLYELEQSGSKDLHSARAKALKSLEKGEASESKNLDEITPWKGEYQR